MKKNNWNLKVAVMLTAFALVFSASGVSAATALTAQMGIGSRGVNVSNLQAFLGTNSSIYPEGLVTGYFGILTSRAVARFQAMVGLPQVGRVGPLTLAAINNMILTGGSLGASMDNTAPMLYNLNGIVSSGQATVSWTSNEAVMGRVYFDSKPITMTEALEGTSQVGISAAYVNVGTGLSAGQSIALPNLTAGQQYWYVVHATDAAGNVTVTLPRSFTAI